MNEIINNMSDWDLLGGIALIALTLVGALIERKYARKKSRSIEREKRMNDLINNVEKEI